LFVNDVIERADLYLDELAKLGLTLARDLHERACAAEDPEVCARLALAFHTVSRGVRQSLALQQRLARDRLRAEAEQREDRKAAKETRKAQVRAAVVRLAWTEKPDWNEYELRGRLSPILDVEAETEEFLQGARNRPHRREAGRNVS